MRRHVVQTPACVWRDRPVTVTGRLIDSLLVFSLIDLRIYRLLSDEGLASRASGVASALGLVTCSHVIGPYYSDYKWTPPPLLQILQISVYRDYLSVDR